MQADRARGMSAALKGVCGKLPYAHNITITAAAHLCLLVCSFKHRGLVLAAAASTPATYVLANISTTSCVKAQAVLTKTWSFWAGLPSPIGSSGKGKKGARVIGIKGCWDACVR